MFWNGQGKRLGEVGNDAEEAQYGARSIIIKRAHLHKVLREAIAAQGIQTHYAKRLKDIQVGDGAAVTAYFEDGTSANADFLVGADGIQSRTRQIMLPNAPKPSFVGLIDCGGFAHAPALAPTAKMQMTFGKQAFFGYFVTLAGEIFWFSNIGWPKEPTRDELRAITNEQWRRRLVEQHGQDAWPIPQILASAETIVGKWPTYDMPTLPTWHTGRVCLMGDAAHATAPSAGQGASLAMEDGLVLAKCVRDVPDLAQAFATYQGLRKARAEKIVKEGRRAGSQKAVTHPVQLWLRDLVLPFFLKLGSNSLAQVHGYQVDWNQPVGGQS